MFELRAGQRRQKQMFGQLREASRVSGNAAKARDLCKNLSRSPQTVRNGIQRFDGYASNEESARRVKNRNQTPSQRAIKR
jgi:transposase